MVLGPNTLEWEDLISASTTQWKDHRQGWLRLTMDREEVVCPEDSGLGGGGEWSTGYLQKFNTTFHM